MNEADRYVKLIEWSEEDACFIGSFPELLYRYSASDLPNRRFRERGVSET